LPSPLGVALDLTDAVASEIFDHHTHFMPPRTVHQVGRWKKVGVLVLSR
jgi:hypothetical protein